MKNYYWILTLLTSMTTTLFYRLRQHGSKNV